MTASQTTRARHINRTAKSTNSSASNGTRSHSREDALNERQFERLVAATWELDYPYNLECRFLVFAMGKLGMRAGEVSHFRTSWINWGERMIEIPHHDPCTKGQIPGEICGYCRNRAKKRLITNNLTISEAEATVRDEYEHVDIEDSAIRDMALELRDDRNLTYRQVESERWQPKTENAARSIPIDFDMRCELTIQEFADEYDGWPYSKATVNRRIDRAAEIVGMTDEIYPHALRATAASLHASRGVSAYGLMSLFGWSDIGTARAYINASDETAAKEIRSAHR